MDVNNGNIFLFIGQFGNQIGVNLVKSLSSMKDADLQQSKYSFISVDTEQKAAKMFFMKSANVIVENCILDKTGRGANWAMGYNLQREHKHLMPMKEVVLMTVRRKVEKFCDRLPGIVMIHSLIGGTGGGFGCCILESIKDEFPQIHVTSITASPFVSGESPMQHYNALFTIAWLQRFADCVLLFHNDEVMNELKKIKLKSATGKNIEKVSLDEINEYICYNIVDLFLPFTYEYEERMPYGKTNSTRTCTESQKHDRKSPRINSHTMVDFSKAAERVINKTTDKYGNMTEPCIDLPHKKQRNKALTGVRQKELDLSRVDKKSVIGKFSDMGFCGKEDTDNTPDAFYDCLVVNHHMKFISCKHKHTRQFTSEYLPLLKSLVLDQPKCDPYGNKYSLCAMLLSARGEFAKVVAYNEHEILSYLRSKTLFGRDCDKHITINTSFLPAASYSHPLSLSLYVNTSQVADYIDYVLCKSGMLYEHSAYTHWFHKFGVTNGYFEEAIDTLKSVVKEYKAL